MTEVTRVRRIIIKNKSLSHNSARDDIIVVPLCFRTTVRSIIQTYDAFCNGKSRSSYS